MFGFRLVLLAAGCAGVMSAYAAEEPIATDRPDFVESSDVVGNGRFQIETSLAVDRVSQDGVKTRSRSTPTLLRIGISDNLELRFETDGALRVSEDSIDGSSHASGRSDVSVGLKWHVQDGDEAAGTPGIGWLLHVDTPTGSREFRGKGLRPSLRLVAEWELPKGYSLGVMPGLFVESNDESKRFVGGIAAVVLGKSLTDKTRVFAELAGQQLAAPRNGGNIVSADVGVAYLLTQSVQVDTAMSWGLSKVTPDFSWTVGLSARF